MDSVMYVCERSQDFFLVLVRITSFFLAAPFYGSRLIPPQVKILFATIVSLLVLLCLPEYHYRITSHIEFSVFIVQQIVIGIVLGTIAGFVFEAIRMAGELIDLQIGFGMAQVIDPNLQMRQTLFGEYNYLFAILLFMMLDGHHFLLLCIIKTFHKVPIYQLGLGSHPPSEFLRTFYELFVTGLKIALPVLTILMIIDIVSGLLSKLIPQLNVFVLSFPFKISAGFIAVIMLLPQILQIYRHIIYEMLMTVKNLF